MRPFPVSSLRARLLLLVLLAVLPALALLLGTAMERRRETVENVQETALRLTALAAHDHREMIRDVGVVLAGLAQLPDVRARDREVCRTAFGPLLRGQPRYYNLGVIDPSGELVCSVRGIPAGTPPSDGLRSALEESLRTGGLGISGYTVGRVSGRPTIMFTRPFRTGDGEIGGVVYAALRLDWLNAFATRAMLPAGASLTVTDPDGRVLVHLPDPQAWIGRDLSGLPLFDDLRSRAGGEAFAAAGPDDSPYLFASSGLLDVRGSVQGYVAVGMPTREALAAAGRSLYRSLAWLALIAALAMGAAWYGGEFFLLRRVRALGTAARRLQAGDLAARTGIERGPGELEHLGRAFDEMAEALQRRQEEAERTAEALRRQALVFDTLHEGVVITDPDWRILEWNAGAERIFGHSRADVVGLVALTADDPMLDPDLARTVSEALDADGRWAGEIPFVRADGSEGISEVAVVAQYDAMGRRVAHIGVNRDVTERVRAEQALARSQDELRQAQKMEAVGRLAGGVAHDFNNLLTAIRGNVELALLDLPPAHPLREDLGQIQQAADTAASLTRQLLAFSRRQPRQPSTVDAVATIAGTAQLLRRMIGASVELETELEPGLPAVAIDPGQLEQILINLAVNARDAMPGGGRLRIEGRPEAGGFVRLTVRDSGVGIDPAIRSRIFEPFFTTKDRERGTGLGLFLVYGIVTQNGGRVHVESRPGEGTAFHVLLPAAGTAPEATEVGAPAEPPPEQGEETILLVDDEAPVRLLAQRLLERLGYRVLPAADGEEALRIATAHRGPVDLLLTDMTMPRMGGREVAERLTAVRPGTRVVFMSGYNEEVVAAPRDGGGGPAGFVHKPFTLTVLARTVRDALDTTAV